MMLSRAAIARFCSQHEHVLIAALLLFGLLIRLPFLPVDYGTTADIAAFRTWARMINAQGVASIYDRTRINYPPLLLYMFGAAAEIEESLSPVLRLDSQALTALIKLPAALADIVTAWLITFWVRERQSPVRGVLTCGLYLFNPAVWYVSAHWGQTDSVYTLFLVATLAAMARGSNIAAWIAYTLALSTKMQSIAVAPLVLTATLRMHGVRGLAGGLAIGTLLAAIMTAPWLITGRIGNAVEAFFTLPTRVPQVDVSGYNLWYLLFLGGIRGVNSEQYPGGLPLSYQQIGIAMFGTLVLIVVGVVWHRHARLLALPVALSSMGLFMLLTEVHERYLFPVLAFLVMSAAERRSEPSPPKPAAFEAFSWRRHLWWIYAVLSLTFLFNLVTIAVPTPLLGMNLVTAQSPYAARELVLKGLALFAAAVNMLVLGWMITMLVRESVQTRREDLLNFR